MESGEETVYLFKIIIIGDAGVGKTNILTRYTKNEFDAIAKPTVGVEFSAKKIKIDNKNIKLQIWDTAGQEKFKAISKNYYKGAAGVMLVYDITKKKSFDNVTKWIEEVRNHSAAEASIIIVANKKDLDSMREVSTEEGQALATEHKCYFLETSALDNSDKMIEKVFTVLAEDIIVKKQEDDEAKPAEAQGQKIDLSAAQPKKEDEKRKGCC